MTDRQMLQANLERYQQAGDFAAQAETLIALAEIAQNEKEYSLAQGWYGQAWAAAQQGNHHDHVIHAMQGIANLLAEDRQSEAQDWQSEARDVGLNLDIWYEQMLDMALRVGSRRNQAETYHAIALRERRFRGGVTEVNALILAFATYHLIGDIPDSILPLHTLRRNLRAFNLPDSPDVLRALKQRFIARYQALGDQRGLAYVLLAYGEDALWNKAYNDAQQHLEGARDIFTALNDPLLASDVLRRLIRSAQRPLKYDLYKTYHTQILPYLTAEGKTDEILALWLELAQLAADKEEWQVARTAYQSALITAIGRDDPEQQADLYWQWGHMEFYKVQRHAAGLALCRCSLVLQNKHFPQQGPSYSDELQRMEEVALL